jgi:hypothetical protein
MLKNFTPFAIVFFWILPVAWVGLMRSNYPLYPAWIAPLFRVTGIFENAPNQWRIFFIEVQDRNNGDWHQVNEETLFAPTPLGDRTRFQTLMNDTAKSKAAGETSRLLAWIGDHLSQAGYSPSQVKTVRIIHYLIPPEMFLKTSSLSDVYEDAKTKNLPSSIVASLNVTP